MLSVSPRPSDWRLSDLNLVTATVEHVGSDVKPRSILHRVCAAAGPEVGDEVDRARRHRRLVEATLALIGSKADCEAIYSDVWIRARNLARSWPQPSPIPSTQHAA